jgi:hypothetical protein
MLNCRAIVVPERAKRVIVTDGPFAGEKAAVINELYEEYIEGHSRRRVRIPTSFTLSVSAGVANVPAHWVKAA